MIVAISYHPGDQELAERWVNHVKKLGPYLKHEIIVCPSHGASTDKIMPILENCFRKVHLVVNSHKERGWPVSCNRSFQTIAWHCMLNLRQPFLFMEPDAIPLKEGWIDAIEAEYIRAGAPFMGDFVELTKVLGKNPGVIDHMSGVAVYHWDLSRYAPRLFNCTSIVKTPTGEKEEEFAWDIFAASDILPKFRQTNLIQHDWQGTGDKPHDWRKYNVEESFVRADAVIYHPDKRGILMKDGLAGDATRVGGELRTGASASVSSFEQAPQPIISYAEKPEIQLETTAKESTALLLERFCEVLARATLDKSLKRSVKEKLISHGWIKERKKGKRSGKKVPTAVGNAKRTVPPY